MKLWCFLELCFRVIFCSPTYCMMMTWLHTHSYHRNNLPFFRNHSIGIILLTHITAIVVSRKLFTTVTSQMFVYYSRRPILHKSSKIGTDVGRFLRGSCLVCDCLIIAAREKVLTTDCLDDFLWRQVTCAASRLTSASRVRRQTHH